jgi:signal transduction histidine kinase
MSAAATAPGPTVGGRRDFVRALLPAAVFWLLWGVAVARLHRTPWLALTAQLWLAYSGAGLALALSNRRGGPAAANWRVVVPASLAGALVGAAAGLPLAPDFLAARLASPAFLLRQGALPAAFALVLHLPALLARLREGARHAAHVERARQAATLAELSRQVSQAQLKALQAQVEPHFLYNTLASAQYLVRHDAAQADRLLTHLGDWLRHALPAMREPLSTLEREFALAHSYLEIMRLRTGGRLAVDVALAEELRPHAFPPLMVATLVENAIKHGVEPVVRPVRVSLRASLAEGMLQVEVVDDGAGLGRSSRAGEGVGLANLRDRLAALHGDAAMLLVEAGEPHGVVARIRIPARA